MHLIFLKLQANQHFRFHQIAIQRQRRQRQHKVKCRKGYQMCMNPDKRVLYRVSADSVCLDPVSDARTELRKLSAASSSCISFFHFCFPSSGKPWGCLTAHPFCDIKCHLIRRFRAKNATPHGAEVSPSRLPSLFPYVNFMFDLWATYVNSFLKSRTQTNMETSKISRFWEGNKMEKTTFMFSYHPLKNISYIMFVCCSIRFLCVVSYGHLTQYNNV